MKKEQPSQETLIERGYVTSDQFVNAITPGLRDYLASNWAGGRAQLHHPEDLATNMAIYTEIAWRVIVDMNALWHAPSEN